MEVRPNVPPVETSSCALVRVRLALAAAATVSVPPAPSSVAVCVQPVTVKVLFDAPPVRLASSIEVQGFGALGPDRQRGVGQGHAGVTGFKYAVGAGAAVQCIEAGAAGQGVIAVPGEQGVVPPRRSACRCRRRR